MYIDGSNIIRECNEEIENKELRSDFYNHPEILVKKMENRGPFSAKESITSISEVDKMENKGPISIDNETIEVSCIPLEAAIKEIVIINGNSNNITVNVNVFQNCNLYEPSDEQIPNEQKPTMKKKQTSLRDMNKEVIRKSQPDHQAFSCDHPKTVMKKLSVAEQKERARQWALKEFGPQAKKKLSVAEQKERARHWAIKEFGNNFFSEN